MTGAVCSGSPGGTLTLLRHGQSEWNRARRFTGWADVALSPAGEAEAARAGRLLAHHGLAFDCCFTSALERAIRTSAIALDAMGLRDVPVEHTWRLNERHYGGLQGLNLAGAVRRFGVLRVLRTRRQLGYRPPALAAADAAADAHLPAEARRATESLADMRARLAPFWRERLAPELARGRRVLVVSHHHTLRALLGLLAPAAGVRTGRLRIPTGVPIVLALDASLAVRERRVLDDETDRCDGRERRA
jgi:2,3-bisphosphoglycerate-dependent phosphoglycerate mutase